MQKVLILGAHGQIARLVERNLLEDDIQQRLFLRRASRLKKIDVSKQEVFEGDATKVSDLTKALADVDLVYANLAGEIVAEAEALVEAMRATHVKRLIWISTLGIYDEVPGAYGKWNHEMLDGGYLETYAAAAKVIEDSGLVYTIIRPAWLTNYDEINYELTPKGTAFKGTEVSRKSVADLVAKIILAPEKYLGASLGVNKPHTDGPKPAWY